MVRISRTYTIDQDIVEKLKEEDNVSELINNLLEAHYNKENSKDLQILKRELDLLDNDIDAQRRARDRKADMIRAIQAQAEINVKEVEINEALEKHLKELTKWLADQVKEKIITFEEYRNIKSLENWADCVEAVIVGDLDLKKLIEQAKPKEEPQPETL